MDWFEHITGFRETNYEQTRAQLELNGTKLRSRVNGKEFEVGEFSMPSLEELRRRTGSDEGGGPQLKVSLVTGDIRRFLTDRSNRGAMFQVASQFNMLEMISPSKRPEDGITMYQHDPTQGPACAIAVGASTIYRNYLVPSGGGIGQSGGRQLNGLLDLGNELSDQLSIPTAELWAMRNGYALASVKGLTAINALLRCLDEVARDRLRGKLRIGVHRGAEVTDVSESPAHLVSQAFCSAMPVAYSNVPSEPWAPLAQLVLEAAYEATLLQAAENMRRGDSNVVFLTRLGGGAFGNEEAWIHSAIEYALIRVRHLPLDVRIVCYSRTPRELEKMVLRISVGGERV